MWKCKRFGKLLKHFFKQFKEREIFGLVSPLSLIQSWSNVNLAVTCCLLCWLGSFLCYCCNAGVEQISKSESAHKADPEKENVPTPSAGNQTCDLLLKSLALCHETKGLKWVSVTHDQLPFTWHNEPHKSSETHSGNSPITLAMYSLWTCRCRTWFSKSLVLRAVFPMINTPDVSLSSR